MADQRRMRRLLNAPSAESIAEITTHEAMQAAIDRRAAVAWERGHLMQDCGRAIAVFPISPITFDALFNGPSGYRAQYYLSTSEGAAFNRMLVMALLKAAERAYDPDRVPQTWPIVQASLDGCWSKLWIFNDTDAFTSAPPGELRPRRRAERHPTGIALCAPLPSNPAIELKGTWLSNDGYHQTQDPLKFDRDVRLHERGHA